MANRKRLDPGVLEELIGFISERLATAGTVTDAEVLRMAHLVGRSESQIRRYVRAARVDMGLGAPLVIAPGVESAFDSSVDAMLAGAPFRFDHDMQALAVAYAGNIAALHRDATRVSPDVISYEHLARKFRTEVPAAIRNASRKGIDGFKKGSLYLRWSARHRNETWQIDATQLDIWVRPRGTTTPVRPWGLFIIDDYTRVIVSATVMMHEYRADDSASCVHRAMRAREVGVGDETTIVGGVPGRILCDNAQQFTGEVMTDVATTLGFMMWAVAVYAGEKKGKVERIIREANEDLCRRLPGYASPRLKTLTLRDALRGSIDDALTEDEFLEELARWVEDKNNSPHPDVPGKTRLQVWAEDDAQLRLPDDEDLRPATVPKRRTPYVFSKEGFRVSVNGVRTNYWSEVLAPRVGDRFMLRHLPGDDTWLDAYTLDGTFVARCFDSRLASREQGEARARARIEQYHTLTSLRSEAVELRSQAAVAANDERPNAVAVAARRRAVDPETDVVRRSLGGGRALVAAPADLGAFDDLATYAVTGDETDTDSEDTK